MRFVALLCALASTVSASGKISGTPATDGSASAATLRTLGTSSTSAAAGNDTRLTTPTGATATPTASKIPIADGTGKLDIGWIPSTAGDATPSVALTTGALPASVNLTTEGTIDWMVIHTLTGQRPTLTAIHAKVRGEGDALASFMWIKAPSGTSSVINGDLDFPQTITNTDDIDGAGLSAYENGSYINVAGTQTGHGFQFRVRATKATRVVRLYMGRNATTVLCTGTLTGGTTSNVSISQPGGSPTVFQLGQKVTITYNSSTDGQFLHVDCKSTTTHATAGTVNFMSLTVASS